MNITFFNKFYYNILAETFALDLKQHGNIQECGGHYSRDENIVCLTLFNQNTNEPNQARSKQISMYDNLWLEHKSRQRKQKTFNYSIYRFLTS